MKLYKILTVSAFVITGLSSCSKTFLNELKPENGSLTDNIIFSTKAGAENALTGIYWIFAHENYNGYGGESTVFTSLTNRGLQTTRFFFEMRGNDVMEGSGSWWRSESAWEESSAGRVQTGSRTIQIWDMFYKVINNANAIIKQVPGIGDASDTDKGALISEAKAVRAYAYFWLARCYQFTYAKNPDAPGVPIYTEPATATSTGNPRAPLREVYKLIVDDLEEAVSKLTASRPDKYRINKNVAQGFLAEVYQELAMADAGLWQKALDNAKGARAGYPLMSNTDYAGGFNSLGNAEWIWGFPIPDNQSLSYYSQFSYMDVYYGYYRNVVINSAFVNSFSATDKRKDVFGEYAPNPARPYRTHFTTKFTSRSTDAINGDIIMMRSAEMYLIEAEALAQQNKIGESIDILFEIQGLRDPAAVKLPLSITKEDLIDAILFERRKELFAEISPQYFDLKRYQRPLVRDGNHRYLVTIPKDDARWLMQLPLSEIDANPNINPEHQNP